MVSIPKHPDYKNPYLQSFSLTKPSVHWVRERNTHTDSEEREREAESTAIEGQELFLNSSCFNSILSGWKKIWEPSRETLARELIQELNKTFSSQARLPL